MPYDGPILDNHFHLRPEGRFLDAVADFVAAGGTHITLIPVPGQRPKRTRADWRAFFERHLDMADRVAERTAVTVVRAIGPYPVEFHRMAAADGLDAALESLRAGYDAAHALIRDGRAAVMGEVGRIHYDVEDDVQRAATELLEYGMGRAHDAGCPIILHTETATPEVFQEFAKMADRAGLARDRVVKHYSGPMITEQENGGLVPSVIASRSNIAAAIAKGDRFLMETDYIDEPSRPNVVLPPGQVPRRTKALAAQGVPEQSLRRIHETLPAALYGPAMDVDD